MEAVTSTWAEPKEGIMEKLLKAHLGIVIAILIFVLSVVGFFLINFYNDTKKLSDQMSAYITTSNERLYSIQIDLTSVKKDVEWLKARK